MSDVMLYGILSMPYEMAMSDELSRFQFYKTVQRLLEKDSQQQAEIEKLRSWVEMLVEVPFFDKIDHYRGIPVSILRKAEEE